MKTLGLIGGMSWESSALYYRIINEETKRRLGGHRNARSVMVTVDFGEIEALQHQGRWDDCAERMVAAALQVQAAGADCVLLCTNTMHRVADAIEHHCAIPLLHIADPTARALREAGHDSVALLGTRFTMEQDFYRGRLRERHGLGVLTPEPEERELVHRVIYEELCHGNVRAESRARYVDIIDGLRRRGAEAVILGCTEIALLIGPEDAPLPVFDTTRLHAQAAVAFALE